MEKIWRCDLVPQYLEFEQELTRVWQTVLRSGRYILAENVVAFENEFATYCDSRFCIGVANATDALTLSLMALGIQKGDEVITPCYTAIPTASAIADSGATPVFVDIDPETFLIDMNDLKKKITKKTKALMPVHLFGNVVDIEQLRLETEDRFPIIEDASQAHGSTIRHKKAGSLGTVGVFSFYPTKNLGGYGDGGAIVTGNESLAKQLRQMRMYGMVDKDTIVMDGINSRLDELQAAVLRLKLPHLDEMNRKRSIIADLYRQRLDSRFFRFQQIPKDIVSNWHVFVCRYSGNRNKLVKALAELNIQTNVYYPIPLHLQKAHAALGYKRGDMPMAEALCEESIALPLYPELPLETVHFTIDRINETVASS